MTLPLPPRAPGAAAPGDRTLLRVEVVLKPGSGAHAAAVHAAALKALDEISRVVPGLGPLELPARAGCDPLLKAHAESMTLVEVAPAAGARPGAFLLPWEVTWLVDAFELDAGGPVDEDAADDDDGDGDAGVAAGGAAPPLRRWRLPSTALHAAWAALHVEPELKARLLGYADSALLFAQRGVDPALRPAGALLLFGPPGTGKSTLARALASRVAARHAAHYPGGAALLEVDAAAVFSRYFGESGKAVAALFARVAAAAAGGRRLVFLLVDEVESIAGARAAAVESGDPSDAVRAVNALLTALDRLRALPSVVVLATSNATAAVDAAFLDRCDARLFVGLPPAAARYAILAEALGALAAADVLAAGAAAPAFEALRALPPPPPPLADDGMVVDGGADAGEGGASAAEAAEADALGAALLRVAVAAEGMSGRALRRLPFLAHAVAGLGAAPVPAARFAAALEAAVLAERADRAAMDGGGGTGGAAALAADGAGRALLSRLCAMPLPLLQELAASLAACGPIGGEAWAGRARAALVRFLPRAAAAAPEAAVMCEVSAAL